MIAATFPDRVVIQPRLSCIMLGEVRSGAQRVDIDTSRRSAGFPPVRAVWIRKAMILVTEIRHGGFRVSSARLSDGSPGNPPNGRCACCRGS